MNDPIEAFRAAIAGAGLPPPDALHGDGALHRFSPTGKRGDASGWYVLHLDELPAGVFGDWRTGMQSTWCSKSASDMTEAERQALRERTRAAQRQRDAEHAQRQQDAGRAALARWQAAVPVRAHPYLERKGVQAHGLRMDGHLLLVPLRDTAGKLHSLQTIAPDGGKRFMLDGRTKGCYHAIGKLGNVLVLTEGYATGASIHEATGHAVAIAFNAGNLLPVARALRGKHPHTTMVLAADDDWRTTGNPGLSAARDAALAVGAQVVVPQFPAIRPPKATDFNDLAALAGPDAVRACFNELTEGTSC